MRRMVCWPTCCGRVERGLCSGPDIRAWSQEAEAVNVHDFRGDATGRAVPYGIYDLTHNQGTVYVGSSGDTAQFAVDAIARWWQTQGQDAFPQAEELLILADGGGSNDCR